MPAGGKGVGVLRAFFWFFFFGNKKGGVFFWNKKGLFGGIYVSNLREVLVF